MSNAPNFESQRDSLRQQTNLPCMIQMHALIFQNVIQEHGRAILERLIQWIFGHDSKSVIMWLYGPAGAGKSAILQTIAEKCTVLDILLASFFFSRSDGTRNHPDSLVATIAYQIRAEDPRDFCYT